MNSKKTVLVTGAGLGGLSAAVYLQAEGYHVKVIEKNHHCGGKLRRHEEMGFSFDLGPSILTMPYIFEQLFEKAGRNFHDYVTIEQLPLEWRAFFEDGTQIDLYNDLEACIQQNTNLDAGDIKELEDFLAYGKKMYELTHEGYFKEGLDTLSEVMKYYGYFKSLQQFDAFSTMNDVVQRYISNPYLVDVMNFFIKYVGSSPYRAPAVMCLLPYIQYAFGLWYIPGGMDHLAKGIFKLAEELGVEFHFGQRVVGAKTNNADNNRDAGKIVALETDSGHIFNADLIVSNMEVIPFYQEVTQESDRFLKKYNQYEPSCSGYVLHLGLDREYPQLAHHNFLFSSDPKAHFQTVFEKYQLPEDPTIYLVAAGKTDPSVAPEGCENLKVLPHIPHIQDTPFTKEEYEAFEERLLAKLERMGLEDLRKHIIYKDTWYPEDIRENYLSNRGAIYGVVSDKQKNKGFKIPKHSEKYSNLYFVGGSVNPGSGMPMVTLSGQVAADKIKKDDLEG